METLIIKCGHEELQYKGNDYKLAITRLGNTFPNFEQLIVHNILELTCFKLSDKDLINGINFICMNYKDISKVIIDDNAPSTITYYLMNDKYLSKSLLILFEYFSANVHNSIIPFLYSICAKHNIIIDDINVRTYIKDRIENIEEYNYNLKYLILERLSLEYAIYKKEDINGNLIIGFNEVMEYDNDNGYKYVYYPKDNKSNIIRIERNNRFHIYYKNKVSKYLNKSNKREAIIEGERKWIYENDVLMLVGDDRNYKLIGSRALTISILDGVIFYEGSDLVAMIPPDVLYYNLLHCNLEDLCVAQHPTRKESEIIKYKKKMILGRHR
ncbi:Hypothetical protein ORPV_119 [Orpheovirus IHUMI-LCC2]|uniref:Uncharacterized protein n=1 Tax=Orpheovirus IHUMI-LCC2 TaxID=2023057 RepID=A0A2I2L3C4_9VIRU|nr:Hypothetical protein ORPV_119 [Orpheovirus IHUMI-LCC2]SNW62023.1 Hypothetical protein ORPV_119 [Orpheovirus IHUMI-LCC2]